MDPFDIREKKALVTGGTRGLGLSISFHLASQGAHVIAGYLQNDEVAEASRNEHNEVKACQNSKDGLSSSFVFTGEKMAGKVALRIVPDHREVSFGVMGMWPPDKTAALTPDFDAFTESVHASK